MHADIAQGRRSQDGIGDGVRQNVGIRVALEAEFAGHRATPPRISGRPAARRWTSHPSPVRNSLKAGFLGEFLVEEQVRQVHVARLGDLDVAVAAQHHAHLHVQALHQAGFVCAHEAVRARHFERALQKLVAEHLGRLRHHQFLARQGGADAHVAGWPRITCLTVSTAGTPTMAAPVSAASSKAF